MKRYSGRKAALALAVIAGLGVSSCEIYAATVNDWYAYYSADRGDRIESGDTSSPTYYLANLNTARSINTVWSYFDSVSLVDGGTMTLSTSISIDFKSVASASFDTLRFGLFQSGAARATVTTFGEDRYVSTLPTPDPTVDWKGFFLSATSTGAENYIYRRESGPYSSTNVTKKSTALSDLLANPTFLDNAPIALTLTYSRVGDDLIVSGFFGGDSFAGTYVGAFSNGYSNVFDALGIYSSNTSGDLQVASVSFSNTTITVVPEPSTVALLVVAGGAVFLFFRKRVRTA